MIDNFTTDDVDPETISLTRNTMTSWTDNDIYITPQLNSNTRPTHLDRHRFTLMQVQVRVGVRVCLHGLASIALYAVSECYITCSTIITQLLTSKVSGVCFCCFHGEKEGEELYAKNSWYFKVTRTRIQNQYYCERLLLEYMQTHVY